MVNQELITYIQIQLQQGIERSSILDTLVSVGWKQEDVQEAFSMVDRSFIPPPTPQTKGGIDADTGQPLKATPSSHYIAFNNKKTPASPRNPSRPLFMIIFIILFMITLGGAVYYVSVNSLIDISFLPFISLPFAHVLKR